MKANELRIGNLVNIDGKKPYIVSDIMSLDRYPHFELYVEGIDYDYALDVTGIPLTEEWLIKLGFEKVNPVGWVTMGEDYYRLEDFVIESVKYNNSFSYQWHKKFKDSHNRATHFKYVHEIQNLFAALTGSELTIKETARE
jgi:hypothetical protein